MNPKPGFLSGRSQEGSAQVPGVHLLTTNLEAKRLGLLNELFPGATQFAVLLNPKYPAVAQQVQELMEAARTLDRPIARTWHARGSTRSLPKRQSRRRSRCRRSSASAIVRDGYGPSIGTGVGGRGSERLRAEASRLRRPTRGRVVLQAASFFLPAFSHSSAPILFGLSLQVCQASRRGGDVRQSGLGPGIEPSE